jgi:hypothetical protein
MRLLSKIGLPISTGQKGPVWQPVLLYFENFFSAIFEGFRLPEACFVLGLRRDARYPFGK